MSHKPLSLTLAAGLALTLFSSCNLGKVGQGRVVEYDKVRGVMTVVLESEKPLPGEPRYALPVREVRIPEKAGEMGPVPDAGKLLLHTAKTREIVFFDRSSQTLRTVHYTPLSESTAVAGSDERVANRELPIVDRVNRTLTLYSPSERILVTLALTDADLALPDDTWKAGDEVRYYYKQPGQALRLMNVTKTDLATSGGGH
jgi:hypothetical protein